MSYEPIEADRYIETNSFVFAAYTLVGGKAPARQTKRPAPKLCGQCPKLRRVMRTDFWPHIPEYWCGENWLGFVSVRCCVENREREELARFPLFAEERA